MKRRTIVAGAFVLAFATSAALAQGPDKEGKYNDAECYAGTNDMIYSSDNAMSGAFRVYLISPLPKPGDLYHNVTGTCVGSWTFIDGQYSESSYCEYTDASGDKFFGVASRKGDEDGNWKVIGGTGKYQGMTDTARWKPITNSPQPDGKSVGCLRTWGSWKLK